MGEVRYHTGHSPAPLSIEIPTKIEHCYQAGHALEILTGVIVGVQDFKAGI
jgi:hypothetical protein